jgi:hypothetical protein
VAALTLALKAFGLSGLHRLTVGVCRDSGMTTHNPSEDGLAHQKSKQWFEAIIVRGAQKMPFFQVPL